MRSWVVAAALLALCTALAVATPLSKLQEAASGQASTLDQPIVDLPTQETAQELTQEQIAAREHENQIALAAKAQGIGPITFTEVNPSTLFFSVNEDGTRVYAETQKDFDAHVHEANIAMAKQKHSGRKLLITEDRQIKVLEEEDLDTQSQWHHCMEDWGTMGELDRDNTWTHCDGNRYMTGFYRGGCDDLHCIEAMHCCQTTSGLANVERYQNNEWGGTFDYTGWSKCASGWFMNGMYRGGGDRIHHIEAVQCSRNGIMRKGGYPSCYEHDMWGHLDGNNRWANCNWGHFLTGMYRSGDMHNSGQTRIHNIEMFHCCTEWRGCGDGTIDGDYGEQCDDQNTNANDACTNSCKHAVCGDGIHRHNVEQCDDGNTNNNDACLGNCKTAYCGDGWMYHASAEECDAGAGNTVCDNACRQKIAPDTVSFSRFSTRTVASWAAPSHSQQRGVQGYVYQLQVKAGPTTWNNVAANLNTPSSINMVGLEPWTEYQFRVKTVNEKDAWNGNAWSQSKNEKFTPWKTFRTTCGCSESSPEQSSPSLVAVTQIKDSIKISWKDNCMCENEYEISRGDAASIGKQTEDNRFPVVQTVSGDIRQCSQTREVTESNLFTPLALGLTYNFCVESKDSSRSFRSGRTCASMRVAWLGKVQGFVKTEQGDPVGGGFVEATVGTGADLVRWTTTVDQSGSFQFDMQWLPSGNAALPEDQSVTLTITQFTENFKHTFVYGGSNAETFAVSVKHKGSPTVVNLINKSVFGLSGVVKFADTDEHSRNTCAVYGAKVCAFDLDTTQELQCVVTDESGKYELAIGLNKRVRVVPTYRNHTFAPAERNLHMLSRVTDQDFDDIAVQTLSSLTYGGKCKLSLGQAKIVIYGINCTYERDWFVRTGADKAYLQLPAMPYEVVFKGLSQPVSGVKSEHVTTYLQAVTIDGAPSHSRLVTLVDQDQDITYAYFSSGELTYNPLGIGCPGQTTVLRQNDPYNFTVSVLERYGNEICRQVDGDITVVDRLSPPMSFCASDSKGCPRPLEWNKDLQRSMIIQPVLPQVPNLIAPHHQYITFKYMRPGQDEQVLQISTIVVGDRPRASFFSIKLPRTIPILILRDPPGGSSYASMSKGTTIGNSMTVARTGMAGGRFKNSFRIGAWWKVDACAGIFAYICSGVAEGQAVAGYDLDITDSQGDSLSQEGSFTYTVEESFSTSDAPRLAGAESDMFLVPSLSIKFSITDRLEWNTTACKVEASVDITWEPLPLDSVNAMVWHSAWDIKNIVLPDLQLNLDAEMAKQPLARDPTKISHLERAIVDWNNNLSENDRQKKSAKSLAEWQKNLKVESGPANWKNQFNSVTNKQILTGHDDDLDMSTLEARMTQNVGTGRILGSAFDVSTDGSQARAETFDAISMLSFAGGGSKYGFTISTETSQTRAYSYEVAFSTEFMIQGHVENKFAVVAVSFDIGAGVSVEKTESKGQSSTYTKSNKVSFELSDPEFGDYFDVNLKFDPVYGTPVFETISGRSSCPMEENTVARQEAKIIAVETYKDKVPPTEKAYFEVILRNLSPTREYSTYELAPQLASNPDGIALELNGAPWINPVELWLPYGDTKVVIAIIKGPNSYVARDVEVNLYSPCDVWHVWETILLNVDYIQPCSVIEWAGDYKQQGYYVINSESSVGVAEENVDKLRVVVKNPEYNVRRWVKNNRLESVALEYRRDAGAWRTALEVTGNRVEFFNNATQLNREDFVGFAEAFWFIDEPQVPDGKYELRVLSRCQATSAALGDTFNQHVTPAMPLVVDRLPPVQFGSAEPADGVLHYGDDIYIEFDEELLCSLPLAHKAELRDPYTGNSINSVTTCEGNRIGLAFGWGIAPTWLKDTVLQAKVWKVTDAVGNEQAATFEWKFRVQESIIENSNVTLRGLTFNANTAAVGTAPHTTFVNSLRTDLAKILAVEINRLVVSGVTALAGNLQHSLSLTILTTPTGGAKLPVEVSNDFYKLAIDGTSPLTKTAAGTTLSRIVLTAATLPTMIYHGLEIKA